MNSSTVAVRVDTWLSSAWHVKVPARWLEACIDWIKQENSGGNLSQAEINKQVYEQWLLTDLRDLEFPVLPDGIADTPKCELDGFYSIQIDSLVDVSQPAYSQLQKIRGKNNPNEQVSAYIQMPQKPWEVKPTRMLMLMLTDGLQPIQGMEYQPISVLHSNISPGTKVMLQGKMTCRLGVILLKPENVKVLGGEVETLVEEYTQEKVLARLIGEDSPILIQPVNPEQSILESVDETGQNLGPSDEELLASLDENAEYTISNGIASESGYCSRNDHSNTPSYSAFSSIGREAQQNSGILQGDMRTLQTDDGPPEDSVIDLDRYLEDEYDLLDDNLFLDEEIQKELEEPGTCQPQVLKGNQDIPTRSFTNLSFDSKVSPLHCRTSEHKCQNGMDENLDNLPYTYLSVLLARKTNKVETVQIKSFIVTLSGSLTSSSGFWSIKAKISDGTAYLDVDFKDEVLTKFIGFSVSDMKRLKKAPNQRQKLMSGLQQCQKGLIDLCCLMTITFNPSECNATVLSLQDVTMEMIENLKKRLHRY